MSFVAGIAQVIVVATGNHVTSQENGKGNNGGGGSGNWPADKPLPRPGALIIPTGEEEN